jgi:glycosyltransferase involved in cell wall biosynthesis
MHQYTADLASQIAQSDVAARCGEDVELHLVTTSCYPRDRYAPGITVHTPVKTRNTGLSTEVFDLHARRAVERTILAIEPDVVHFTGPHLWNVALARAMTASGVPVVHTLHALDTRQGTLYGLLLGLWNYRVICAVDHILVHSQANRDRLLDMGMDPGALTCTPLLHLFMGGDQNGNPPITPETVAYEPWALFFGRLDGDKGLGCLLTALDMMNSTSPNKVRAVIAGPGDLTCLWAGPLPKGVDLRNRIIPDAEAIDLFRRCGLVVLPYVEGTQSALVAAAYHFCKPVVVTRTGALPEYVEDGCTGRIVEANHPPTLARCLQEMLSDSDRLASMGAAGKEWYEHQKKAETQTMLGMYRDVVRTRAESAPVVGSPLMQR